MGEQKESKPGWIERRREKKRLKLERTGDSPEKQGERRKGGSSNVKEDSTRAGSGVGGVGLP
jgi:hypothetical protein